MDKENLPQFLKQPYSRHNWLQLFSALFAKFEQLASPVGIRNKYIPKSDFFYIISS